MTNEFDNLLKQGRQEPDADQQFWERFGWARMRYIDDQNTDRIPDNFNVDFGCPKCGSVWTSLRALGFIAPRVHGGAAEFLASIPIVRPDPMSIIGASSASAVGPDGVRAARLVCADGHITDFDALSRRKHTHEPWAGGASSMLMMGSIMALGVMAYAYGLGKK